MARPLKNSTKIKNSLTSSSVNILASVEKTTEALNSVLDTIIQEVEHYNNVSASENRTELQQQEMLEELEQVNIDITKSRANRIKSDIKSLLDKDTLSDEDNASLDKLYAEFKKLLDEE